MNGLGRMMGLAASTTDTTTGLITSISNAIAQDAPIIQGKVAPPGFVLDPKTGKFVPANSVTPTPGSSGGSAFNFGKYIPYIVGGVVILGFGYMMLSRKKRSR